MIKIRFFAMFRDHVERAEVDVEPGEEKTLKALLERLKGELPGLERIMEEGNAIFALNQEVVEPDAPVKDGDEIAVFPPVSGG
jgi:molybdopterin synthase sulfur carrier subunit